MMAAFYGLGFANIFLRSTMGVLAPELAAELSLSPQMLGAIASGYFVSYALLQIPTGILLDRFGPWLVVNAMFLLTVIGIWLFAASQTGEMMLLARVLMGMGCAGVFACAFVVISRFFPAERFTSVGGFLNSFGMLGTLCATVPLAALVVWGGWRAAFVLVGLLMACVSLWSILMVRDAPSGTRVANPAAVEDTRSLLRGLWRVCRTRGVLPLAGAGFALAAGNTLLGIWGGPYLNDVHELDEVGRGSVLVFMAVAGVVGHFVYGLAARWFNTLKWLVVGSGVGIVLITATLASLSAPSLWVVQLLLVALGFVCSFPTILIAHARALVPAEMMGRGLTTVNTGIMVAIAIMQIAMGTVIGFTQGTLGWDAESSYRAGFAFMAFMAVLSVANYLRVDDKPPRPVSGR